VLQLLWRRTFFDFWSVWFYLFSLRYYRAILAGTVPNPRSARATPVAPRAISPVTALELVMALPKRFLFSFQETTDERLGD